MMDIAINCVSLSAGRRCILDVAVCWTLYAGRRCTMIVLGQLRTSMYVGHRCMLDIAVCWTSLCSGFAWAPDTATEQEHPIRVGRLDAMRVGASCLTPGLSLR